MPTIDINRRDLENLCGFEINKDKLEDLFLPVKGEVDGYEEGQIKLDVKDSNRPDLWCVEGVARELRLDKGIMTGLPKYNFNKSDYVVDIENVENIRPKAAYALAKNVDVTDELLKSIIQMQEKICGSYGKKRKEIAIGIFDLDKINGKKLKYFGADKSTKFVPLGFDESLTLTQILENHPKGKEYGHLISSFDKYPLLLMKLTKFYLCLQS
jgi:phenylalanyl-tRNA synthetase beta chain